MKFSTIKARKLHKRLNFTSEEKKRGRSVFLCGCELACLCMCMFLFVFKSVFCVCVCECTNACARVSVCKRLWVIDKKLLKSYNFFNSNLQLRVYVCMYVCVKKVVGIIFNLRPFSQFSSADVRVCSSCQKNSVKTFIGHAMRVLELTL